MHPAQTCLRLLGALLLAFACSLGAPWAQAADISESREIEIGDELAISLLEGGRLLNQDRAQEYVNQIGRWLTVQTERPDLPWQFGIMDRPEIGAYALPGGKVLITRGMVRKISGEAELAGVLAHEIAHIVQKHQLRSFAPGTGAQKLGAVTVALERATELEADRMAAVIMARAGYDPSAYTHLLRTLDNDRSNDPGLALLSEIHPPFKDRIAQLQAITPSITPNPPTGDGARKSQQRFSKALGVLKK